MKSPANSETHTKTPTAMGRRRTPQMQRRRRSLPPEYPKMLLPCRRTLHQKSRHQGGSHGTGGAIVEAHSQRHIVMSVTVSDVLRLWHKQRVPPSDERRAPHRGRQPKKVYHTPHPRAVGTPLVSRAKRDGFPTSKYPWDSYPEKCAWYNQLPNFAVLSW